MRRTFIALAGSESCGREIPTGYSFPSEDVLAKYLALLARVLVDARFRAGQLDPQLADLLGSIHNVPDLLARWPEARDPLRAWVAAGLLSAWIEVIAYLGIYAQGRRPRCLGIPAGLVFAARKGSGPRGTLLIGGTVWKNSGRSKRKPAS